MHIPLLDLLPLRPIAPSASAHGGNRRNKALSRRDAPAGTKVREWIGAIAAAAAASDVDHPAEEVGVWVPARFAAAAGALRTIGERDDLDAEAWRAVAPRSLVEAAAFFGTDERELRRLVELVHHRVAVARACPRIAAAIAADADGRFRLRGAMPPPPWSLLTRVAMGTPLEPVDVPPSVPRLFPPYTRRCRPPERTRTSDAMSEMLPLAARRILEDFSDNVVMAGGFAGRAALDFAGHYRSCFHDQDIDFFVWVSEDLEDSEDGVPEDRVETANAVLAGVLGSLLHHYPLGRVLVSANAVTFTHDEEDRPSVYQIILRLYSCPDEVVLGFDLAASAVALHFDEDEGRIVAHATDGFLASAGAGAVWVDPERQSDSYAWRLVKYEARGYDVLLFGVDEARLAVAPVGPEASGAVAATRGGLRGLAELLRIARSRFMGFRGARSDIETLHGAFRARGGWVRGEEGVSDYADGVNREAVLHASDASLLRAAGTTRLPHAVVLETLAVTWKTRAPGEQVTGTFHPRTTPFYTGSITEPYSDS